VCVGDVDWKPGDEPRRVTPKRQAEMPGSSRHRSRAAAQRRRRTAGSGDGSGVAIRARERFTAKVARSSWRESSHSPRCLRSTRAARPIRRVHRRRSGRCLGAAGGEGNGSWQ
jgi:hypothetical protein